MAPCTWVVATSRSTDISPATRSCSTATHSSVGGSTAVSPCSTGRLPYGRAPTFVATSPLYETDRGSRDGARPRGEARRQYPLCGIRRGHPGGAVAGGHALDSRAGAVLRVAVPARRRRRRRRRTARGIVLPRALPRDHRSRPRHRRDGERRRHPAWRRRARDARRAVAARLRRRRPDFRALMVHGTGTGGRIGAFFAGFGILRFGALVPASDSSSGSSSPPTGSARSSSPPRTPGDGPSARTSSSRSTRAHPHRCMKRSVMAPPSMVRRTVKRPGPSPHGKGEEGTHHGRHHQRSSATHAQAAGTKRSNNTRARSATARKSGPRKTTAKKRTTAAKAAPRKNAAKKRASRANSTARKTSTNSTRKAKKRPAAKRTATKRTPAKNACRRASAPRRPSARHGEEARVAAQAHGDQAHAGEETRVDQEAGDPRSTA